ncbi:MAG: FAD-dependent oxidoreductase [Candidatus Limnocylindria bacterium]
MPDTAPRDRAHDQVDVLVYGATAGGVMAAIAAAEEGAHSLLVSANAHVGGMVSGGLGKTDTDALARQLRARGQILTSRDVASPS